MLAEDKVVQRLLTTIKAELLPRCDNEVVITLSGDEDKDKENAELQNEADNFKAWRRYQALVHHYRDKFDNEFKGDTRKVYRHFILQHIFPRINKGQELKLTETDLDNFLKDPKSDNPIKKCAGQQCKENLLHRAHTALRGLIMPDSCVYTAFKQGKLKGACPPYQYHNIFHINSDDEVDFGDDYDPIPITRFMAYHLLAAMDPAMAFNEALLNGAERPSQQEYLEDSIDMAIWTLAELTQAHADEVTAECHKEINDKGLAPLDSPSCMRGIKGRVSVDLSRSNPIGTRQMVVVDGIVSVIEKLFVEAFQHYRSITILGRQRSIDPVSDSKQSQAFNALSQALLIQDDIGKEDKQAYNQFLHRCRNISAESIVYATIREMPALEPLQRRIVFNRLKSTLQQLRDHLVRGLDFNDASVSPSAALIQRLMQNGGMAHRRERLRQKLSGHVAHAELMLHRIDTKYEVFKRLVLKKIVRCYIFPNLLDKPKLNKMLELLESLRAACLQVSHGLSKQTEAEHQKVTEVISQETGFKLRPWSLQQALQCLDASGETIIKEIERLLLSMGLFQNEMAALAKHNVSVEFINKNSPFKWLRPIRGLKERVMMAATYLFALMCEQDLDKQFVMDELEIGLVLKQLQRLFQSNHDGWVKIFEIIKVLIKVNVNKHPGCIGQGKKLFQFIENFDPGLKRFVLRAAEQVRQQNFIYEHKLTKALTDRFAAEEVMAMISVGGPFVIPTPLLQACQETKQVLSLDKLLTQEATLASQQAEDNFARALQRWLETAHLVFQTIQACDPMGTSVDLSDFIVLSVMQSLKLHQLSKDNYQALKSWVRAHLQGDYVEEEEGASLQARLTRLLGELMVCCTQLSKAPDLIAEGTIRLVSEQTDVEPAGTAIYSLNGHRFGLTARLSDEPILEQQVLGNKAGKPRANVMLSLPGTVCSIALDPMPLVYGLIAIGQAYSGNPPEESKASGLVEDTQPEAKPGPGLHPQAQALQRRIAAHNLRATAEHKLVETVTPVQSVRQEMKGMRLKFGG